VHGNSHLQSALVECGWGATRKKDCFFKRKYESLVGRRGKKKVLVAVGHKIIIAVCHVLLKTEACREPVLHNSPRKQKKTIKHHLNKLKNSGIEINEVNNHGSRICTDAFCARA
jgi:hypothetical protein